MTEPFRALFIHGVGSQGRDWYHEARTWMRAECKARGSDLHSVACWWAPHADRAEKKFLSDAEARGSVGNLSQRLTVLTLADALYWQSSRALRETVFYNLDLCAARFAGEPNDLPFTIFAHSLGGLIATDWLRQRPLITNVRMCTLGCNIGLFNLGASFVPVPGIRQWSNYYYRADMLGYALAGDPNLAHVKDHEVPAGLLGLGWFSTGLSHTKYWSDARFWRKQIARDVLH